jgi:AcrR family transcriptional regulator
MNERSFISTAGAAQGVDGAIVAAAVECFGDRGFHGTSMRQIAAAAGTGLGNIYNYFGSKSDILLEVLRRANTEQRDLTGKAIAAAGDDVRDRLAAAVAAFVRFDVEHQAACFVANSELRYLDHSQRGLIVAERDEQQQVFEDLVDEGVAEGAFHTPHAHDACVAILTMCSGVTLWYRPDGPLTADDVARRYARFALAMVEAA